MTSTTSITPSIFSSTNVHVDPTAPGTVFRTAALVESAFNIFGGSIMIAFPSWCLSWMANSTPSATVSTTQWLGALTLGLTPQLLLSARDTRTGIESRQMAYMCLLAGEGFLIPMMIWQALAKSEKSGFSPTALVVASAVLGGTAVWRLLLFLVKPEWFGRYYEEDVKVRKASDEQSLLQH